MNYFLTIFGALLLLGSAGYLAYCLYLSVKEHQEPDKKGLILEYLRLGSLLVGISIGAYLVNLGYLGFNNVELDLGSQLLLGFGCILFFLLFGTFVTSFVLYYYKRYTVDLHKSILGYIVGCSFVLSLFFFAMWLEGGAKSFDYPLVSGFSIDGTGWHWTNYTNYTSFGKVHIQFYALCIVSGAIFVYFLCDHKFYQKYGKHGLLESTFFVAFPSGIIGARAWYVVGNWNGDLSGGGFASDPLKMFNFTDGGLTIIGGAVFGILGGVLWVYFTQRKRFNVLDAADIIVPTILLAQAIGRWGNFFNHEVYGGQVSMESCWWLPNWLKYQMAVSFPDTGVPSGNMYVPLFLYEGILNIAGYFIIVYGCKGINAWAKAIKAKKEAKLIANNPINGGSAVLSNSESPKEVKTSYDTFLAPGVIASCYLIVYGVIRAPMELLRDPKFNMGTNGLWSVINSIIMIGGGILLIVLAFVYRKYKPALVKKFAKNKKAKNNDSING